MTLDVDDLRALTDAVDEVQRVLTEEFGVDDVQMDLTWGTHKVHVATEGRSWTIMFPEEKS